MRMKDHTIQQIIEAELTRDVETIDLIPSDNFPSPDVQEAMTLFAIGKYAEGYPGKRYYEGREDIDALEELVRTRAKKLFGADHANVQAYSGSIANLAIYNALAEPGDKIMGLELSHGGHLSHGWKVTLSAKLFKSVQYGLNPDTHLLDYDAILKLAKKEKPRVIISGYTAYPREVDFDKMSEIAHEVGAYHLADISHIAGLVVAGEHPDPFPEADVVMTTTHKMLRGPRGAIILCKEELAEQIDKSVFPGIQGGPHMNIIAGIGVALGEAETREYKDYAKQVKKNAHVLAEALTDGGLDLVTGGTDNHLMLVDATNLGLTGSEAAEALLQTGINVNRNTVPFDSRSPFDPSGFRLGTPRITTRGWTEDDMKKIGDWIAHICMNAKDKKEIKSVKDEVETLIGEHTMRSDGDFE
ncbi:serine hydroxymethyltransferase [Patescibacteria group bacterium]